MLYALENLGKNVPARLPNSFYSQLLVQTKQQISSQILPLLVGNDRNNRLTPDQIARLEKIWGKRADEMANWNRTVENLQGFANSLRVADRDTLRSRLRDENPVVRQITLQVIAQRRFPLAGDLIDLLRDSNNSAIAHEALVRVARGTDFGPFPGSSRRGIDGAIAKWRNWLALQQGAAPEKPSITAAKQTQPATLEMVPLVLVQDDKPALSSGITKACDELVNARGDQQMSALARLRDAKNSDSAATISLAIPKLSGDIQQQAREALTERLTRLPSAVLRDKLQDDNPEVRSAAALACGRKIAKDQIAELLQLLDDPEMAVVQSARVALTELSGEDFGPTGDVDRRGHAEAAAAWRKWWKERQNKKP